MIKYVSTDYGQMKINTGQEFLHPAVIWVDPIEIITKRVINNFIIVKVFFLPPTLIASMYGMSFQFIPESDEIWSYPFAILLMIMLSLLILLFFKRKKWL